jgi:hypothetical protein
MLSEVRSFWSGVSAAKSKRISAMKKFVKTAVLALALGAGAYLPAAAQSSDQTAPMMGMMGGGCPMMGMMGGGMTGRGMMGGGMMAGRQPNMGAMAEGRLAYLKGELAITDAQTEAWNGYAEAVKGRVETMRGMRQGMMDVMQKGSATDRMNARISGMETMLESMKAIGPATEKLYGVLTDDQKKVADELIGNDCGAM